MRESADVETVTAAEAARRLGITREAVARAIRRGTLPTVTVLVPQTRITVEAVRAYRRATAAWRRGARSGRPAGSRNRQ